MVPDGCSRHGRSEHNSAGSGPLCERPDPTVVMVGGEAAEASPWPSTPGATSSGPPLIGEEGTWDFRKTS